MPRRSRIVLAGIPWHIIQRGNNRTACFYRDEDYRYYLATLQEQAKRYGCAIHAYVLMTNHVHLLLTPLQKESTSLVMKHLGQRYVQYINKTYRRSGTLWEGRFRSCLMQEEQYVLNCYRYIELNPVRAAMVKDPALYPWSSYNRNALGGKDLMLTSHPLYRALEKNTEGRQKAYRALFKTHLDIEIIKDIREATNGNFVLGNDKFKEQIEEMLKRRVRPGRSGRPKREVVD